MSCEVVINKQIAYNITGEERINFYFCVFEDSGKEKLHEISNDSNKRTN